MQKRHHRQPSSTLKVTRKSLTRLFFLSVYVLLSVKDSVLGILSVEILGVRVGRYLQDVRLLC